MDINSNSNNIQKNSDIKSLGIISMVCGLVSLALLCIMPISAILAVAAIVSGIIALVKINKAGYGDKTYPVVGIASSSLSLIAILFLYFGVVLLADRLQQDLTDYKMELDSMVFDRLDSLRQVQEELILDEPDSTFYIDDFEIEE